MDELDPFGPERRFERHVFGEIKARVRASILGPQDDTGDAVRFFSSGARDLIVHHRTFIACFRCPENLYDIYHKVPYIAGLSTPEAAETYDKGMGFAASPYEWDSETAERNLRALLSENEDHRYAYRLLHAIEYAKREQKRLCLDCLHDFGLEWDRVRIITSAYKPSFLYAYHSVKTLLSLGRDRDGLSCFRDPPVGAASGS